MTYQMPKSVFLFPDTTHYGHVFDYRKRHEINHFTLRIISLYGTKYCQIKNAWLIKAFNKMKIIAAESAI